MEGQSARWQREYYTLSQPLFPSFYIKFCKRDKRIAYKPVAYVNIQHLRKKRNIGVRGRKSSDVNLYIPPIEYRKLILPIAHVKASMSTPRPAKKK